MTRIEEFIQYLESKIGNIYVWGAQGERVDNMSDPEAWIRKCEKKNGESYVERALAFWHKVKASGKTPIEAYDCSGLIVHYIGDTKGWIKGDASAEGLYSMCINKKRGVANLSVGDFVFKYNDKKERMGHVGVYVGSGMTIESYGRDKGVCKRRLEDDFWSHSGRLTLLGAAGKTTPPAWVVKRVLKMPEVTDASKKTVLMRGDDIKELQKRLIAAGFVRVVVDNKNKSLAADGTYGEITRTAVKLYQRTKGLLVDGKAGKATITALGGVWEV